MHFDDTRWFAMDERGLMQALVYTDMRVASSSWPKSTLSSDRTPRSGARGCAPQRGAP